jgi:restriction system protein
MGRRRKKDDDLVGLIAQFVGLLFLLSMFSPQVRQTIFAIGLVGICFLGLAVFGLIGFGIYRIAIGGSKQEQPVEYRVDRKSLAVAVKPQPRRTQTTVELLEQVRSIDWFQFEKLVELVYQKLGYTVTRRGGANPDGGIDLMIEKDGQQSAIQCKQWKTWNVGVRQVREFLGALTHAKVQKGIFITLRGYTGDAKMFADEHNIEMLNENDLTRLLDRTDARFDPQTLALLKDTKKFCPKCEREMVLKIARKGRSAGQQFWACPGFPRSCNYTMPFQV